MALESGDAFQPFSTFVGNTVFGGLSASALEGWRVFGYWGALGSVLAFLAYFPYTKHVHIFMAPLNYTFKRQANSGTLPPMKGLEAAMEAEEPKLGVEKLEDLEWPRLLDAYACIQCNRCQDVCPASATGKALSPAALEINKRMELNVIASHPSPFTLKAAPFETGASTAHPLLEFAISEEAVWACTTCGACMQVCPVQDEQMLDIIDIRRQQVMVAGEFPAQLQTAFRGMERAQNPWGLSRDKRFEWADGLNVPTIDENPEPDIIYWVGCAASYDPGAQKVARAFVQLLDKAGVNYAVLGKKEACTGDSARRAGNEFLYQTLAQENIQTLNQVRPKLIVATCPHCMNMIGNEYPQLGGHYQTMHHTEYLENLVAGGQLQTAPLSNSVTYHDPCYLGRHNGVYDAPRHVIQSMGVEILELERSRENSFCCGAGGAQFWKEEEEGDGRISDNRFQEIQARLDSAKEGKVLAVGCPFCKSMLGSTPDKQGVDDIVIKDVAELLLESVQRAAGEWQDAAPAVSEPVSVPIAEEPVASGHGEISADAPSNVVGETTAEVVNQQSEEPTPAPPARKKWGKQDDVSAEAVPPADSHPEQAPSGQISDEPAPARKKWSKVAAKDDVSAAPIAETVAAPTAPDQTEKAERPKWKPGQPKTDAAPTEIAQASSEAAPAERPKWKPGAPKAETAAQPAEAPVPAERPKWRPGAAKAAASVQPQASLPESVSAEPASPPSDPARPKWTPKARTQAVDADPVAAEPLQAEALEATVIPLKDVPAENTPANPDAANPDTASPETGRQKWSPKKKPGSE